VHFLSNTPAIRIFPHEADAIFGLYALTDIPKDDYILPASTSEKVQRRLCICPYGFMRISVVA
jgi:hypothetical protein